MGTYLVTGGSGFFGQIMSRYMIGKGHTLVNIDLCDSEFKDEKFICFKGDIRDKELLGYKILGAIGILFLLSILMSIVAAATVPSWSENLVYLEDSQAVDFVAKTFRWFSVWTVVIALGEAVGIYYRIKTLKH